MKVSLMVQIISWFLLCYLLCVVFMYLRQDAFLFFPTSARHENHNYDGVLDYHLQQGQVSLRGWLVNPGFLQQKLLIYYGGNAEDVFQNIEEYQSIQAATLFVAYQGYGPSSGKPSETAFYADALAAFDDMVARHAPQKIYLLGRSLGSGVACYVAGKRSVAGTILITPYDSIENVAKSHYPWLPVSRLLKHRFSSLDFLPAIRCPLLVLYAGKDRVVPPPRSENLIRHIQGKKEVLFLPEADHGTIDMYPEYWQAVLTFIHSGSSSEE